MPAKILLSVYFVREFKLSYLNILLEEATTVAKGFPQVATTSVLDTGFFQLAVTLLTSVSKCPKFNQITCIKLKCAHNYFDLVFTFE